MLLTTFIYGFNFAISILFCYIYEKKKHENTKFKYLLFICATIPLIVISTLRYKVGTDYGSYIINYRDIMKYFNLEFLLNYFSKEPLYVLSTYLGGMLDLYRNGAGMFFVYACIFVGFTFAGIYNFKDKISVPLAVFIFCVTYYLVSYNAVRQMIAVAIVFWNFKNIWDKKPIKYIFFTIVAGLFHRTAYAMILLYFLIIKIDSKTINKIFYALIILSPFFMPLIHKLFLIFANTFNIYISYTKLETSTSFSFLLYIVPNLIMLTLHRKAILEIDSKNEILYRILYLQIPFQFLGNYILYADRIALYFGFFQIIAVPLILKREYSLLKDDKNSKEILNEKNFLRKIYYKYNNEKTWRFIIILWYVFYFIVMFIILNSNGVYPYQTIFNKNISI